MINVNFVTKGDEYQNSREREREIRARESVGAFTCEKSSRISLEKILLLASRIAAGSDGLWLKREREERSILSRENNPREEWTPAILPTDFSSFTSRPERSVIFVRGRRAVSFAQSWLVILWRRFIALPCRKYFVRPMDILSLSPPRILTQLEYSIEHHFHSITV